MLQLVIFDMDGVIFAGKNFWLDLHRAMGTERQAWQLWNGLSKKDYVRLSQRTAEIWKGRSAEIFADFIGSRSLVTGIESVFDFVQQNGLRSAIISTGPYQLAQRAQKLFNIDAIRANRLDIDAEGRFLGTVDVAVEEGNKGSVARDVMESLGVAPQRTAVIGDSEGDATMAQEVGLSIAYDSSSDVLDAACEFTLRDGDLGKAVAILKRHHLEMRPELTGQSL
ncbi:MAG: HAD-IB family phosphatase [Woeseiaceae bacterium]|nr:HAD-IB family phosphatase [Woeseiaceae bacterium]